MTTDPDFLAHLLVVVDKPKPEGVIALNRFFADNGGSWVCLKRLVLYAADLDKRLNQRKMRSAGRRERFEIETPGFSDWYAASPRHTGKLEAMRAYSKARRSTGEDVLLAGAKRYAGQCAGSDPKFIAMPATWLNQGRWNDEYPQAVQS